MSLQSQDSAKFTRSLLGSSENVSAGSAIVDLVGSAFVNSVMLSRTVLLARNGADFFKKYRFRKPGTVSKDITMSNCGD